MNTTFRGELQLMNWGESSNSGAWVKFWLSPEDLEMFRSLKCRSGKIAGHRMAAVLVEIDDSEQPVIQQEQKPKGGELAKLAGIWCNDLKFYEWISVVYDKMMGGDGIGEVSEEIDQADRIEFCKHAILAFCNIESRAELDNNEVAAEKFHRLVRIPYSEWIKQNG